MKRLKIYLIYCLSFVLSQDVIAASIKVKSESLYQTDDVIWGFDFLSNHKIIFTERGGKLKIFDLEKKVVNEVKGVPTVYSRGQGGLLDVRVRDSNKIFLSYSKPTKNGAMTAIMSAELKDNQLVNSKVITTNSESENNIHFGSRIEFDNKGNLYFSVGDRNERSRVQDLKYHNGKVLSVDLKTFEKAEVYSFGHRNPQGLVFDPNTEALFETEMGPRGGDELNRLSKGKNYGWPVITYGREYYGPKIGEGTHKTGMEQPLVYWVPSISPSALTIYTGDKIKSWVGSFFIGCLSGQHIRRVKISEGKVVEQEEILKDSGERFRNLRTGPDGYLYFSTDSGKLAKLIIE